MNGLTGFTGEGFFELDREEQKKYEETIYILCNNILEEMKREYPMDEVKLAFLINLKDLEKHFNKEEDYEMAYLMKTTIRRIHDEYKIQNG